MSSISKSRGRGVKGRKSSAISMTVVEEDARACDQLSVRRPHENIGSTHLQQLDPRNFHPI